MASQTSSKPRRILLKISGEALAGDLGFGIDPAILSEIASAVIEVRSRGVQAALVIGGGNVFRGAELQRAGFDRVTGDQMGMLATIMNGLAMREELKRQGGSAVVMSAYGIPSITTQYSASIGRELLASGATVICSGGTGSPFFTTDTGAVLRAIELQCDEVLKATKVDGVYSADPVKDPSAERFDRLTFSEVMQRQLKVMDLTAFALASEHQMPIRVFSMKKPGALVRAACGGSEGTLVSG